MSTSPIVIIDGAHNPAKMISTAENLKLVKHNRCILVLGMASNKDARETLRSIVPFTDAVYLTRSLSSFRKVAGPNELKRHAEEFSKPGVKIHTMIDPTSAFKEALRSAGKNDAVLVTGSFFLAGDIRALYYPESFILRKRRSK
jgi:folylpolyglutamate synthase/dihydropteroate synthase